MNNKTTILCQRWAGNDTHSDQITNPVSIEVCDTLHTGYCIPVHRCRSINIGCDGDITNTLTLNQIGQAIGSQD